MSRPGRFIREAAAATIFAAFLTVPAFVVATVTYFALGFLINVIRTVYL
jgi:hypothetical protein